MNGNRRFCFILIGLVSLLQPARIRAAGTVTVCDEANLRAALTGGGLVTFACDGVLTLSNTCVITNNTALDAGAHAITISGNNSVRIFQVPSASSLALTNLTLANGQATNGGAVYNEGTLVMNSCILISNAATGVNGVVNSTPGTDGAGGAVYNSGTAYFRACTFSNNVATGGNGGEQLIMTSPSGGYILYIVGHG